MGSRLETELELVRLSIPRDTRPSIIVVHGACPTGVDSFLPELCRRCGYGEEAHTANWDMGLRAGPIRNEAMAAAGADLCLAFPMGDSRGTWDMIRRAVAHGIRTTIIPL